MNCDACLDWIDSGAFAATPNPLRTAAEAHAAQCPACAAALAQAATCAQRLCALEEPIVSPSLEAMIMDRVLASDEAQALVTRRATSGQPEDAASDALLLRALGLGTAVTTLAQSVASLGSGSVFDLFAPMLRGGLEGVLRMPEHGGVAIGLACGSVLLLGALIASVGPRLEPRSVR
ncbi:MAG: hypothetical protein KDJ14_13230 [Xanthomonadales bacterium]|nr:hypothetical protein [Xanthomonadales bacterium]